MAAWISREEGSNMLSESEAENNILCVYDFLSQEINGGWTKEAVAGVGGNMWEESHLNPGQWQLGHFQDTKYGYGLGQWTPATKLINGLAAEGLAWQGNGDNQLHFLNSQPGQWHTSYSVNPSGSAVSPYISFEEYKKSTLDVNTLSDYWLWFWEDPGYTNASNSQATRRAHAQKYYALLKDYAPGPGPGPGPSPTTGFPWYFWCKKVI